MQPSSKTKREIDQVCQSHLLNTFSMQVFDLMVQQYLDPRWSQNLDEYVDPRWSENPDEYVQTLKNDLKLRKFIHDYSVSGFAAAAYRFNQYLQKAQAIQLDSPDFVIYSTGLLLQKAITKAKRILEKAPRFVEDCCGWGKHPKLVWALLPSQIDLVESASQNLNLTEAQKFNLLAALTLSNNLPEITPSDARFIAELGSEVYYKKELPINCLEFSRKAQVLSIPKRINPNRVYLALSLDLKNRWAIVNGYILGPQQQKISVTQLKTCSPDLVSILDQSLQHYRNSPIELDEKLDQLDTDELEDLESELYDFDNTSDVEENSPNNLDDDGNLHQNN